LEPHIVHLYVFDTLSDWEPGYATAGLNSQSDRYRVMTVAERKAPVHTSGGVTILPDLTLDELEPERSAMLILPGGDSWDLGKNTAAVECAQRFLAAGVPVAAICGATAGLGRAGILDNVKHTSNALAYIQATNYRGSALYQDQPAVTDGDIITASSTAPVDFAYHIFKKLGVFSPEMLEAWYGLFSTGDPAYFEQLTALASAAQSDEKSATVGAEQH
jgi:putative intracellular protease/amidase